MTAQKSLLQRGFTLIELVVVIGIIGILSTIGLLGLNRASAAARDVQRQATMNGIRNGLECYMRENGIYPDAAAFNWGDIPTTLTTICIPSGTTIKDPSSKVALSGTGGVADVLGDGTITYTYTRPTNTTYKLTLKGETKSIDWYSPN